MRVTLTGRAKAGRGSGEDSGASAGGLMADSRPYRDAKVYISYGIDS